MQTRSHAEEFHGTGGHDHAHPPARRLLTWVLVAAAFLLNAYLAAWFYPDNPVVGELSAAVGAILLALPILRTAWHDLRHGHMHMDELVAIAVLAAMAQGDFRTAGAIAFFMLLAQIVETRTAEGAHAAIESLIRLTPSDACRLGEDGSEETVPAADLRPGDRVRVRAGENVPADGEILRGTTTLNEATITGESIPADKGPGQAVFAGTQNLTGSVEIRVTRAGADTTIGHVRELILGAERTRLPINRLIDNAVRYYTPLVLMIAALVWFFTGDWNRMVAVLVISCPCALIIATPSAMVAALSAAARLGILVKHVASIETLAKIDAVVFDKTGTLTTGRLGVARLAPADGVKPHELLFAAGSAEKFSRHPVAQALQRLAEESGLALCEPDDFHEEPGQGVRATVGGEAVLTGRPAWLDRHGVQTDAASESLRREGADTGLSIIQVARGGVWLGWIAFRDETRPDAAACLARLRDQRVRRLSMVTGDRAAVAERVAAEIGCGEVKADCLPGQKVEFVEAVKAARYRVAVVGDGVNDAPALAAGDIGIAMGAAGSDVAIHSASVALMSNDLLRVPFLLKLSRQTLGVVHQNLGVGVLFILGGMTLSGLGLLGPQAPIVAALLHNAGTLVVVFNSGRLIRAE